MDDNMGSSDEQDYNSSESPPKVIKYLSDLELRNAHHTPISPLDSIIFSEIQPKIKKQEHMDITAAIRELEFEDDDWEEYSLVDLPKSTTPVRMEDDQYPPDEIDQFTIFNMIKTTEETTQENKDQIQELHDKIDMLEMKIDQLLENQSAMLSFVNLM